MVWHGSQATFSQGFGFSWAEKSKLLFSQNVVHHGSKAAFSQEPRHAMYAALAN